MRFRCVSCEIEFEVGEGKIRCPQCLRQHGLEEVLPSSPRRRRFSSRALLVALALTSLAGLLALGAVLLWKQRTDLPRPGQLAILDEGSLRRALVLRGVPETEASSPFAPGPALRALAAEARGGNELERARAIVRATAKRLAGLEPDLAGVSEEPVRTAEELARALTAAAAAPAKKGATGERQLRARSATSCELAVLLVAALRAAGLDAVLGVARKLEAPTSTPDVAGGITRYLAILYRHGSLGHDPLLTLDPLRALSLPGWAGGGGDPEMAARVEGVVPLDDGSAAAHLLALRGFRLARGAGAKPEEAYALTAVALKAAAPSATLHLLRAAVLAAAGGVEDALGEAKQALALEDGAATRTAVARLQASTGRAEAVQSLEQAIRADSGYWPARIALAALTLPVDAKRGEAELDAARKLAPEEPALLMLDAMRALSEGGAARAVPLLRKALRARPSPQAELLLYQALRLTGEVEAARSLRARLLGGARADERRRIEQALDAIDQLAESASQPTEGAPEEDRPPARRGPPKLTLPDVKLTP